MGKGVLLKEGNDVTIVATGIMVAAALEAAEKMETEGVSAEVINIHTIKPLDKDLIIKSARKTGKVVTAEEHTIIGGLGGCVRGIVRGLSRTGVQDRYQRRVWRIRLGRRPACEIRTGRRRRLPQGKGVSCKIRQGKSGGKIGGNFIHK